jgi:hypothetical protein
MIVAIACGIAAGIIALLEVGRRVGMRRRARMLDDSTGSTGTVDATIFGLMGLLLAFTFSGAASRWEWRRNLIVQEANDIGTAYLRLDLLPPESQPQLRDTFRKYVGARLAIYRKLPDIDAAKKELARAQVIQDQLWRQVVSAAKDSDSPAVMMLVLSNVNEMLDITTTRTAATQAHLPGIVFAMLGATVLACSLLAGYNMAWNQHRSWVHIASYTILVSVAVYLILELEYPRLGFVRIEAADDLLIQELDKMHK